MNIWVWLAISLYAVSAVLSYGCFVAYFIKNFPLVVQEAPEYTRIIRVRGVFAGLVGPVGLVSLWVICDSKYHFRGWML
jgi:hypothetical protein